MLRSAPVVDVEDPSPGDVVEVEAELVAVVEVIVDHRRQQVVRRGHGVEVTGEVQVEQLHRDHLAVAAAGGATLDPERRAHRRLAERDHGVLVDVLHRLAEPDRGGGLALAERCRRDRGDHHVLGLRAGRSAPRSHRAGSWRDRCRRAGAGAHRCPSSRRSPPSASRWRDGRSRDRWERTSSETPRMIRLWRTITVSHTAYSFHNTESFRLVESDPRPPTRVGAHGTPRAPPDGTPHPSARPRRWRAPTGDVGRGTRPGRRRVPTQP